MTDNLGKQTNTDHELILLLKKEIEELTAHAIEVEDRLEHSQNSHMDTTQQLAMHEKLSAQHGILNSVFWGVISLIMMMGALVIVGWFTKQTTIEREMAFFERILLVLIGIVGGAVSSFFDIRNFTISGRNGNGNGNGAPEKKHVKDTD
ncbi:uncharacterized protein METZ01_LOCUS150995 [marine metagenome]|uniref:Uncharacterized protein n=1 Tax=marine metagenome TaxID=408172 RepID=A0A382AA73_9ZZZZ